VNELRTKANGRALYTVLVDIWGDDVSGNSSKSYNKHDNMYMANRCIRRRLLQQEFHVHFLSTSQHATIPEQWSAVREQIAYAFPRKRSVFALITCRESYENPIPAYDALDPNDLRIVLFRIEPLSGPADNPMQSLQCAHIGMRGNFFCRKCKVGGTGEEKVSDDGFKALTKVRISPMHLVGSLTNTILSARSCSIK